MGQNPDLAVAREGLVAAGHRVLETRAGYLPQAVIGLSYKRGTMNSAMPPYLEEASDGGQSSSFRSIMSRQTLTSYDNLGATLNVSQLVWDFGRTGGAYDSAKALRGASSADLRAAREAVHLGVTQAYFGVLASQEMVAAAEEVRRQMAHHLEVAQAQVEAGVR